MSTQQTIQAPQSSILPETVRDDIWRRAAHSIMEMKGPTVWCVDVSRRDADPEYETQLRLEAEFRVLREVAVNPNMHHWGEYQIRLAQDRETTIALRNHRTTLVSLTPELMPPIASNGWILKDIADTCTDARVIVKEAVRATGRRLKEQGFTACLDPTEDVLFLRGVETQSTRRYPFFASIWRAGHYRSPVTGPTLEAQVVVSGRQEYSVRDQAPHIRSPTLADLSLDIAACRRVAVIYHDDLARLPPANDAVDYRWRGLDALWPLLMPNLREIYLVDESIKPRDHVRRGQLEAMPSFKGFSGTFYEVAPGETDTWDIRTAEGELLLPVFGSADELQEWYELLAEFNSITCEVAVKVMAHIPLEYQVPV